MEEVKKTESGREEKEGWREYYIVRNASMNYIEYVLFGLLY